MVVNLIVMPAILLSNDFRFFFYSRENNEPANVHEAKGDAEGNIWLEPVLQVVYLIRFTNIEQREL